MMDIDVSYSTKMCQWTWMTFFLLFLLLDRLEVSGQVTLELRGSGSFFLEGSSFNFTCVQTGTAPGNILQFLHNNASSSPVCLVENLMSCTFPPGAPCGCVSETGCVRTYAYRRSNMQANDTGNWTCQLPGFPPELTVTSPVLSLPMYDPPSQPSVTSSLGPAPWLKGQNLTLTCMSSDPGRPNATYHWLGGHGGSVKGDNLEYASLGEEQDSRVVQCQAVNSFTSSRGLSLISNYTLVVHYPPVMSVTSVPALQPDGSVTVTEKCVSVRLTCSAFGNPSPSSLSWSPQGGQWGQLTFDPVTRDHHGLQTCTAVSNSTKFGVLSSNVTVNITVLYPPDVTVEVTEVSPREQRLVCSAQGRPASLRFGDWVQSWRGQEVRRVTGSQQSLTLTSFQDTGTYRCSADNGVQDCQGGTVQEASSNVSVWDIPQLLPNGTVVSGETGEARRLLRQLYAFPVMTNATWYFRSANVSSGGLYNVSSSPGVVRLSVHGKDVSAPGTSLALDTVVTPETVGVYTLRACNVVGCSSANITLLVAGPPFAPGDLNVTGVSPSSISLSWTPGFPGGDFVQWFLVEFRLHSLPDQWTSLPDKVTSSSVTVGGLQPGTVYVFRVRAQNSREVRNLSNYTVEVKGMTAETVKATTEGAFPVNAVAGGVAGGAAAVVLIALLVVLLSRRATQKRSAPGSGPSKRHGWSQQINDAFVPDGNEGASASSFEGLQDNPLYESSMGVLKNPVQEDTGLCGKATERSHPIFDDLEDNPLYESSANATVNAAKAVDNEKRRNKETKKKSSHQDHDNVYAVVNKKKKTNRGDTYENVDLNTREPEEKVYENGTDPTATPPKNPPPEPVREIHDDGCVYISVEGASANAKRRKPPTAAKPRPDHQWKDDAVIYTDIDHSKKAPPMDSTGEEGNS